MMNSNPYEQYKKQSVMTASPGDLTTMLYDGLIKDMKFAIKYIDEMNIKDKNIMLQKAQSIVIELMSSLDMNFEISHQLFNLYEFVLSQLVQANIRNDKEKITESIEIVTELRDTWKEAIKLERKAIGNE